MYLSDPAIPFLNLMPRRRKCILMFTKGHIQVLESLFMMSPQMATTQMPTNRRTDEHICCIYRMDYLHHMGMNNLLL